MFVCACKIPLYIKDPFSDNSLCSGEHWVILVKIFAAGTVDPQVNVQ